MYVLLSWWLFPCSRFLWSALSLYPITNPGTVTKSTGKSGAERQSSFACLCACYLPVLTGTVLVCKLGSKPVYCSLVFHSEGCYSLIFFFIIFFSSVLRKLTCILGVWVLFCVLHPLCRKSSFKHMWEVHPSPFPGTLTWGVVLSLDTNHFLGGDGFSVTPAHDLGKKRKLE